MKILTVGPYERDNFGDILFFLVLRKYFANKNVDLIPSSIVYSDMRDIFGERVLPYDYVLANYKVDAVWIVGGEIGGVDIDTALSMYLSPDSLSVYKSFSTNDKASFKKSLLAPEKGYAYIPNMNQYDLNKKTPLVINSVGALSRAEKLAEKTVVKSVHSVMKQSAISVRDNSSFDYLKAHNITALLAPDVVHVLPKLLPIVVKSNDRYLVFQISADISHAYTASAIGDELIDISLKHDMAIRMFIAGTAPLHDDSTFYDQVIEYIKNKSPNTHIFNITSRDPLELVNEIATSSLWIGSSLHGRIIAASYKVPRVSFDKHKVNQYAHQWDPEQPYAIKPDTISKATQIALQTPRDVLEGVSTKLIGLSYGNLEQLTARIEVTNKSIEGINISQIEQMVTSALADNQKNINELLFLNSAKQMQVYDELHQKLRHVEDKNRILNKKLDDIRQSKLWWVGMRVYAFNNTVRNMKRRLVKSSHTSASVDKEVEK